MLTKGKQSNNIISSSFSLLCETNLLFMFSVFEISRNICVQNARGYFHCKIHQSLQCSSTYTNTIFYEIHLFSFLFFILIFHFLLWHSDFLVFLFRLHRIVFIDFMRSSNAKNILLCNNFIELLICSEAVFRLRNRTNIFNILQVDFLLCIRICYNRIIILLHL